MGGCIFDFFWIRRLRMSKRIVSILVVCLITLTCVFAASSNGETEKAGNGLIDVSVAPSAFQWIKVGDDIYKSTSGFSASAGYINNIWKGLSVGAAIEWSNYKQEKLSIYGSFNNVALLLRCGYSLKLSEKVFASAGIGLGYEAIIAGKNVSHAFSTELSVAAGIDIDDVFSVTAGVMGKAVIQKGSQAFSVMPSVGAGIKL